MSLKQLDKLGVNYRRTTKWVGEVGVDRRCVDLDEVKTVQLPLTAEEWCSMCTRDGENYMGPCCGNMGAMQDVLNGVFRETGWTETSDFRRIADACINHDGFKGFTDEGLLSKALEKGLEGMHPWDKVGVVWQAAQNVLTVQNKELLKPEDIDDLTGAMRIASYHLRCLRWAKLWTKTNDGGQSNCLYKVDLAATLAALRTIYDELEKRQVESIEGFALRDKDGKIGENHFGAAMFEERTKAEEMLEISAKNEKFDRDSWSIVPFRVTVGSGLEWL